MGALCKAIYELTLFSFDYLGLYSVTSGNYDASYNITSDELTAQTTTVPSPTTFLADSVDGGYSGIEEISNYADGAELTFTARVFDVAGNYTDWLPSTTQMQLLYLQTTHNYTKH